MFSTLVTPRFGDIDGLRHVTNTVLPIWFEQARNEFYFYFNTELNFEKWNLILVRFEIDFVNQMYYGKDIEIHSWVSRVGNSSFEISQEAWQNGVVGAKGKTVIVYFDFEKQKSMPIPQDIKDQLLSCQKEN